MMKTLEIAALEVLRACLDLAEVDCRPTIDLLSRLMDHDPTEVVRLLNGLRRARLVQDERLALTMAGLAIAVRLAPLEPAPIRAPQPRALAA